MTQVIKIFQTLGHSTGFMTEFIPGACYKMETVVRSEMLQNGTPKDDIIFMAARQRNIFASKAKRLAELAKNIPLFSIPAPIPNI